ncbi:MAG: sugar ABC transporter permease [Pseudobutyrivibrio sp.]|nr:sugar ABC transporter permease [Pseudobutyrivibrio sp.]
MKKNKSKFKFQITSLYMAPSALGMLLFYVAPFVVVIYFSLINNPIKKDFVGLENYIKLARNDAFIQAIKNTTLFSMTAVPLAVVLSLVLAFWLNSGIYFKSHLRSAFLTPLMVPIASIVLIWQVLFDYSGVVNELIEKCGAGKVDWLKTSAGMLVILLLFLWKNLGYNMILFLSAMSAIPEDIIEVAKLDGAGKWRIFFSVKIRYLMPTIVFTIFLSTINSFKIFREIYMLTGGYPVEGLYMLQHYMNNTFQSVDYQKLSTAAIYMSIVMIIIIGLLFAVENYFGKDLEDE